MNMSCEEYDALVGSGSYLGGLNNIRLSDKYCFSGSRRPSRINMSPPIMVF